MGQLAGAQFAAVIDVVVRNVVFDAFDLDRVFDLFAYVGKRSGRGAERFLGRTIASAFLHTGSVFSYGCSSANLLINGVRLIVSEN